MILAAGRGERMRPLTDTTPKPLLKVAGKALIEYHIERLVKAGCSELVINVSWLGEQIIDTVGDGSRWGIKIQYSIEPEALETAGGIAKALPLLGKQFLVVNADIWTDYPFEKLLEKPMAEEVLARLVMVDNPAQHASGDFYLLPDGRLSVSATGQQQALTFAGIARYDAAFFEAGKPVWQALRPVFEAAIAKRQIDGEHYVGKWFDIGSSERLDALNQSLQGS
jgi:MurNAc alpha-1-phosphate uridylyltransferase